MRCGKSILIVAVLVAMAAGCENVRQFQVYDAHTHRALRDVTVHRYRTETTGLVRRETQTTRQALEPTDASGRTSAAEVSDDDTILFDREGYWPTVVRIDWPRDRIESHSYDAQARDARGFIAVDTVRRIKQRVQDWPEDRGGGRPVSRRNGTILVPLYPIGGGG